MKGFSIFLAFMAAIPFAHATMAAKSATAVFAGGCFWSAEADFEKLPGVLGAESGYTGGHTADPKYVQLRGGKTGHAEAVRVTYDPDKVSYEGLLQHFWHHIDPTVTDRQFCDIGAQYRTAIYYDTEVQRAQAEASKARLLREGRVSKITTPVLPAATFYPAEPYHQDYYKKNARRYQYYRTGCGRDARLAQLWGPPAK